MDDFTSLIIADVRSSIQVAAAEGKAPQDIQELPEATDVPAGVVRLSELQEQRNSYIRV